MSRYALEDIRKEYNQLDAKCGVDTSNIKLVISKRAIKRFGCCYYAHSMPVKISIADFIMDIHDAFWDTIRHEYAHALVRLRAPKEKHGHDEVFFAACREVGCDPSRLSRYANTEVMKRRQAYMKYIVRCNNCGCEWTYVRAGKVVRLLQQHHDSVLSCSQCGRSDWTLIEK